jgi:O-antigen/teichoic acid export membrane protein
MSAQSHAIERPLAAPAKAAAKRQPLAGAGIVSIATVASGLLTYAFLVLTARTLGPTLYGQVGVLWGAMFIGAIVLFRPLEQTISRAIADRRARDEEVRSVVRSVVFIAVAVLAVIAAATVVFQDVIANRLFGGDHVLAVMLGVGVACYGISYVVRGVLGGLMWFTGYGINLLADGLARFVLALPLLMFPTRAVAAGAVVGAGLAGAIVPLVAGRGRIGEALASGRPAGSFHVTRALGFAAPASTIAASDQLLVNGAPILVVLGGGSGHTAGIVFAATMLVRAPVYVFQGLAAALLPNLTTLYATEGARGLRSQVLRVAGILLGLGTVVVLGAAVAGTFAMRVFYGSEFTASRWALVLLAAGVAVYLAATTFSQALLALDSASRSARAWAIAGIGMVALYFALPGSQLMRVSASFAVATGVLGVLLLVAFLKRLHR